MKIWVDELPEKCADSDLETERYNVARCSVIRWHTPESGRDKDCPLHPLSELIEKLESLRIDIDTACEYCDPTGALEREYTRANDMLDEAIGVIKEAMEA